MWFPCIVQCTVGIAPDAASYTATSTSTVLVLLLLPIAVARQYLFCVNIFFASDDNTLQSRHNVVDSMSAYEGAML